jgi:glucose/arabinose dehydrogenase
MIKRVIGAAGVAAALAVALVAPAASASSGPPPPPVSTNGQKVALVASGLMTPTAFAWGDGHVFEGDGGSEESQVPNGGVYALEHGQAVKIPSAVKFVGGLAWRDGQLFIAGGVLVGGKPSWRLWSWSGWNGKTFTARRTLYTAGGKFDGFNGIGFGAGGRLYVGADVGLTDNNDHGPASTSPFVYDILTFSPAGTDMRVFAKGIRQPWQMAFTPGSDAPYVTDLGPDAGAKNPPDFVLHVHEGDNYGFPKCDRTAPAKCAGFTKPYRGFGPHTDLMGIAASDGTLYLTSFLGQGGKGPGGAVFTLGLHGGSALKPLLKGFAAPTVGLGLIHGYLYVGELTGQVFRLKV